MAKYVVQSKVKEYNKKNGLNTSADVMEKLDEIVKEVLDKGKERTKGNGRKTMKAIDL